MADSDDELLALAGDESDGEFEEKPVSIADNSPTSSPREPSIAPPTAESAPPSPEHQAPSKKSPDSATRRTREDSAEEGEASSRASSPRSLGSDAMDESGSESGADMDNSIHEGSKYPLEGKFRDAADKAEIMAMSQLERETLLAERAEEQVKKTRDLALRNLLEAKDREGDKSATKKRKASAAELEDSQRSVRPKNKRDQALESYTRQRENAHNEDRKRSARHPTRRSRSPSSSSEREDDRQREPSPKFGDPNIPATYVDARRIFVDRRVLHQYCFYPNFDDATTGCFVRVCTGMDQYKIMKIKGYTAGKPYLFGEGTHAFYTEKYLSLSLGKGVKQLPMTNCSNQRFDEDEWERYRSMLEEENLPFVRQYDVNARIDAINKVIAHRFTSEELSKKIQEQRKFEHLMTASAQPRLPPARSHDDIQDRLHARNERNRKQNETEVRQALIQEKFKQRARAKKMAAEEQARKEAAAKQNTLAVPKSNVDDLFSEGSDASRVGTPVPAQTVKPKPKVEKKTGIPTFTRIATDDEVIGEMDFEIDLEI
ncbi:hypothetical protein EJ06DRAFT_150577 [Trichodelitschia bisporula]|uniref:Plus3 domain-containing protein n=1 Tax=Trichodelitschia bisporula TaxID=703511 RepID=A0A6G1HNA0_9PEZI|nr:hypothetical protein EJ06DRAFT_150577 [Trichodelitschia bisporula]